MSIAMIFVTRVNGVQDKYTRGESWRIEPAEESEKHEDEEGKQRRQKFQQLMKSEKKSDVIAEEVMSKALVTLSPDTSLKEAWELIRKKKIGHFPVLSSEGKLMGLLTGRDIITAFKKLTKEEVEKKEKATVKDVMKTDILCASPNTEVEQIAEVFFEEHVGVVPVVDKHSKVVGIVTPKDILKTIIKVQRIFRKRK